MQELGEVGEGDGAFIGAVVAGVELGIGKAAAEGEGVAAESPDCVGAGHEAILEDAGEGALGVGAAADVDAGIGNFVDVPGSFVAVIIDDGDAGEIIGAEGVERGLGSGQAGDLLGEGAELLRRERLSHGAVDLFTDEAKDFDDAEIGAQKLGVGDRGDLAACVEVLGEATESGVGVGRGGGIVLVVILEGEGVFGIDDPIEIGDGLIGEEVSGAWRKNIFGEIDGGDVAACGGNHVLAVGKLVIEHGVGERVDIARREADGGDGGRGVGDWRCWRGLRGCDRR